MQTATQTPSTTPNSQNLVIQIGDMVITPKKENRWKVCLPTGGFTLHFLGGVKWMAISGASSKQSQHRPTIHATSLELAALQAEKKVFGKLDPAIEYVHWTVSEVLGNWWNTCQVEPKHKKDLWHSALRFIDFCTENQVYYWKDLPSIDFPQSYVNSLNDRRLTRKTIQHYLTPLRAASKWMENKTNGKIVDFLRRYKIPSRIGVSLTYDSKMKRSYLPFKKVNEFIEWAQQHHINPNILTGIALQAYCGLQLQEATRLTWDRVCLHEHTILIEEDRRNIPEEAGVKNRNRVRKIPIPARMSAMLSLHHKRKGCPSGQQLILETTNWKYYSKTCKKALRKWNPKLSIAPKDLRKTLPSEMAYSDMMSMWVRAYLGHAPQNETERSYLGKLVEGSDPDIEDLQVKMLRTHVVENLNRLIDS